VSARQSNVVPFVKRGNSTPAPDVQERLRILMQVSLQIETARWLLGKLPGDELARSMDAALMPIADDARLAAAGQPLDEGGRP
jgi:hypothetical protein